MKRAASLIDRESHFDFGKNWAVYSCLIDERRLADAVASLTRLVPDIAGKSFLDIGCGSGLFSLSALRLGARRIMAIDIDSDSVSTTEKVLASEAGDWTAKELSVFDLDATETFDVVYSWGVLHHTGDMWRAIETASKLVGRGGTFVIALYERTPLCTAWRLEKRVYSRAAPVVQKMIRGIYKAAFRTARFVSGRGFSKDDMQRGMHFDHDVHDWLGGYPYESTTLAEVDSMMRALGFTLRLHNPAPVHLAGLFGTGCSEYVYTRHGNVP